ncbi:hypothetical protein FSARC_10500 [Fusarium sarcochroum]|uniref:Heterokaryon incompatibility domain-containing protein n=1 Tax=Fusarium sarcochroum TaxID=1208366 RepID=A0A8H4X389_9HYPO|nr:hypothetical protein FSARC_10500 [Fusarium sarcochroum]
MMGSNNFQPPPIEFRNFKYSELSPSSIRLLSFIKRPNQFSPPSIFGVPLLECILESVDIENAPEYDLISSTRGNPRPVKSGDIDNYGPTHQYPIAVNGRIMYVPRNIYEALKMARDVNDPVDRRHEPFNKTELIQAAEEHRIQIVQECLQQGAYIHAQDCFGETAIHYAAENGHLHIVELLLDHGASMTIVDSHGRTPLDCLSYLKPDQWNHVEDLSFKWNKDPELRKSSGSFVQVGRPIWIDAVCIDPLKTDEQVNHTSMISQIYSRAQSVVAWLGVSDDETEIARNAIRELLEGGEQNHQNHNEDDAMCEDDSSSTVESGSEAESEEELSPEEKVSAVVSLLRRSWFERPDLMHEVAFGRAITAYCGSHSFLLSEIMEYLRRRDENEDIPSDLEILSLIGNKTKKRESYGTRHGGMPQKKTRRREE